MNQWIAMSALAAAIAGYGAGFSHAKARGDAALARQSEAHAKAHAQEMVRFGQQLNDAIVRGNRLSGALARAETALHKKNLEVHREIEKATVGRVCLSADVVWMLNATGELPKTAELPETPGQPDAENGAASSNSADATDTDIAKWIAAAKTEYGICKQRLNGLIDWHGE